MMDFLRKHMRIIFIITLGGLLAGVFIGFGSYSFGGKTPADAVAEVNGTGIPYKHFSSAYNRAVETLRNGKEEVTNDMLEQKKQEVLQDLIQEEVFSQVAKQYGIKVSDMELAADLRNYPAFQKDGQFDQRAYFQVVFQVLKTTPHDFEESRRRQISIYKLRQLIASSVKITGPELQMEYSRANKGNMKNFEKEKDKFLENLRQEKVMMVFNEWFKQLNQSVKIKVHLQEIEKGA
ncbi:MAG TPA: hypothetical protein DEE98_04205 [Elusimicrobia bacterium]|nr:MAG: hypothetical protein A2278_07215 [Elusimicrobia bacterium RIFOXYA12_FULL_49_49]OGS16175.1 MAG: hypothetical protein A2251_00970 [Elusimicrobia bacterium RIFOXYA2_FULL_47_53]OGS26626.1 MAG: hypothetical protein A2339_04390 [Elusimicrobia bacterium RIFOXYB12_FULL_50_12]OGS31329.1 MAG: hypothetical protein A2323_09260 [Elusimicrobia bacterium RIFOXYB2_FULL_46_23]HBU69570.1 hypothetical protein [Elusimicrobiota bacterium]